MAVHKSNYLVVDAPGFLKYCNLQDLGNHIYTVPQVVEEIKDASTRQRLQVLPYELKLKDPSTESLYFVTEFSKKSGDYPSLSATDLRIVALTYDLEKDAHGTDHLKTEPEQKKLLVTQKSPVADKLPGFYWPSQKKSSLNDDQKNEDLDQHPVISESNEAEVSSSNDDSSLHLKDNITADEMDSDSDDDDKTWITSENLHLSKSTVLNTNTEEKKNVEVACLTTDFAMQNVLMQIGLHVVSVDGILIKETKTYILRCFSCYKTTSIMTKVFCPHCGNKTLKRVAVTVMADGSQMIHLSKRPINIRGTKYSLPMPKGGKHANNPVLCEDQRIPQQRISNFARRKVDALDPDYIARSSPFAMNDVFSRAANVGISVNRHNQNKIHKVKKRK